MLSLLSLIIASGTVLRADTELWLSEEYPDPRTNATCNTVIGSTVCDPDHILTDAWRQKIRENIAKQVAIDIPYTDEAAAECHQNATDPIQIYVILAKRIHTASNQSISTNEVINFGHGVRDAFGLDEQSCKNYILILGVELAKKIYVWTGSDLAIPKELMDRSLAQYEDLFNERNYMEGLDKIVDEIGDLIADPFKDMTTAEPELSTLETEAESSTETATQAAPAASVPAWIYVVMILCILIAVCAVALLVVLFHRKGRAISIQPYPLQDAKVPPTLGDVEQGRRTSVPYMMHTVSSVVEEDKSEEKDSDSSASSPRARRPKRGRDEDDKSITSEVSLPRSASMNQADTRAYLHNDFVTVTSPRKMVIRKRAESISSSCSSDSSDPSKDDTNSKVKISPLALSTDRVMARRNSETCQSTSPRIHDHFSSF